MEEIRRQLLKDGLAANMAYAAASSIARFLDRTGAKTILIDKIVLGVMAGSPSAVLNVKYEGPGFEMVIVSLPR